MHGTLQVVSPLRHARTQVMARTRRTALGGMNEIATVSLRRTAQVSMRVVG